MRQAWVTTFGATRSLDSVVKLRAQFADRLMVLRFLDDTDPAEIETAEDWVSELDVAIRVRRSCSAEQVDTWRRLVQDAAMTCQNAERAAEGINAPPDGATG
jgi:hypothetical protein